MLKLDNTLARNQGSENQKNKIYGIQTYTKLQFFLVSSEVEQSVTLHLEIWEEEVYRFSKVNKVSGS